MRKRFLNFMKHLCYQITKKRLNCIWCSFHTKPFPSLRYSWQGLLDKTRICDKIFPQICCNLCFDEHVLSEAVASGLQLYLKKRLWDRCFPANFVKFLRIIFLIEHLYWLLLYYEAQNVISISFLFEQNFHFLRFSGNSKATDWKSLILILLTNQQSC